MANEDRDKSAFSMDVSYLHRLNFLLYCANYSSTALDIYNWYHNLLALYRELSTEMKEKELQTAKKLMTDIHPYVMNDINIQKKTGKIQVTNQTYIQLHDFELYLRQIMKKSGLLLKMAEDPSFAIGR